MNNERTKTRFVSRQKAAGHALWEQLQRRAQPLGLEFCSAFFNNEMDYKAAQKWLLNYGIKVSVTALQGFYNSLDMRLRYASLQAAQSAETARAELPADIEQATRDRIAQHKFELAFMNLGENQRLQLIQLQQNEEGMKGNFALKKEQLSLKRMEVLMKSDEFFARLLEKAKELLGDNSMSQATRIAEMRKEAFKDVEALQQSGKLVIPK